MVKILLIDHHDSFTYNLAALLRSFRDVKIDIIYPEKANIEEIKIYDKLVFSPGPGLPSEYPFMHQVLHRYKKTKSILGVCLGHQAIGEYFGARLTNHKQVHHGRVKQLSITEPNSLIYKNIPDKSDVGLYHSWYIDRSGFPNELRITALSNDGIIMSMEHKEYDIHSVQFHPESFITVHGREMIGNWIN
jgi:anthranilate synthase/aminodeoxychorismate synthase-like glutamine amidotransferase